MLFCVRQIKVWYKTCANNWPTTGPPKASFRCDGDNDGGTDDDRDDDHEDGYDDEDNEEETSEVDEHQGFFRHVRKHRSPKTNNLFSDTVCIYMFVEDLGFLNTSAAVAFGL